MEHSPPKPCLFCNPEREVIVENEEAIAVYDGFPVSEEHTLVIHEILMEEHDG